TECLLQALRPGLAIFTVHVWGLAVFPWHPTFTTPQRLEDPWEWRQARVALLRRWQAGHWLGQGFWAPRIRGPASPAL
ncbi:MAG: hypothetical protein ACPIOQ_83380, partial [Promethearchaeia archaeon]